MDSFAAFVFCLMVATFGFIVGLSIGELDPYKTECEQSLPRDVECVWTAPVLESER